MAPVNPIRVTARAQLLAQEVLRPGDIAMDGTAGKGRDTACLAQAVGPTGHVHAFDIQPAAIAATANLLTLAGLAGRATLHTCSHADLAAVLPPGHRGRLGAALFNLGYLPGGAPDIITQPESTRVALRSAHAELRAGGRLICVAYTGHPGGETEAAFVRAFGQERALAGDTVAMDTEDDNSGRPWILCVTRPE